MEATLFFRQLFTPVHVHRWNQRQYTSNNQPHGLPPAWSDAANAESPIEAYPLMTAGTVFLQTARDEVAGYGKAILDMWDNLGVAAQERMLEFAGVCAYSDPNEAYWHAGEKPDQDSQRLVAFYGFKVCDLGPEQAHGGVLAAVVKSLTPMTAEQFIQHFFDGNEPPNPHGD